MAPTLTFLEGPMASPELALRFGSIPFDPAPIPSAEGRVLPSVTVDGVPYAGATPVLRYCGLLADLYPKDPLGALQCDEMLCALATLKAAGKKDARAAMERVDALIARSTGPFALGGTITVADLELLVVASATPAAHGDSFAKCAQTVRNDPGVQAAMQAAMKGGE